MRFPFMQTAFVSLVSLVVAVRVMASPETEMTAAANNFLAALNDDQKAVATFEFKSDERENWHFIPKDRKGITLGTLKPAQRQSTEGRTNPLLHGPPQRDLPTAALHARDLRMRSTLHSSATCEPIMIRVRTMTLRARKMMLRVRTNDAKGTKTDA